MGADADGIHLYPSGTFFPEHVVLPTLLFHCQILPFFGWENLLWSLWKVTPLADRRCLMGMVSLPQLPCLSPLQFCTIIQKPCGCRVQSPPVGAGWIMSSLLVPSSASSLLVFWFTPSPSSQINHFLFNICLRQGQFLGKPKQRHKLIMSINFQPPQPER